MRDNVQMLTLGSCLIAILLFGGKVARSQQQDINQQQVIKEQQQQQQHSPEPYSFSYSAQSIGGLSTHQESGDGSGRVTGFYTILGEDGRERRVDYVADENGFRANVKTNEIGTRSESSADAQYSAELPSPKQLEAAKISADDYRYLEEVHESVRERSSKQVQQRQLAGSRSARLTQSQSSPSSLSQGAQAGTYQLNTPNVARPQPQQQQADQLADYNTQTGRLQRGVQQSTEPVQVYATAQQQQSSWQQPQQQNRQLWTPRPRTQPLTSVLQTQMNLQYRQQLADADQPRNLQAVAPIKPSFPSERQELEQQQQQQQQQTDYSQFNQQQSNIINELPESNQELLVPEEPVQQGQAIQQLPQQPIVNQRQAGRANQQQQNQGEDRRPVNIVASSTTPRVPAGFLGINLNEPDSDQQIATSRPDIQELRQPEQITGTGSEDQQTDSRKTEQDGQVQVQQLQQQQLPKFQQNIQQIIANNNEEAERPAVSLVQPSNPTTTTTTTTPGPLISYDQQQEVSGQKQQDKQFADEREQIAKKIIESGPIQRQEQQQTVFQSSAKTQSGPAGGLVMRPLQLEVVVEPTTQAPFRFEPAAPITTTTTPTTTTTTNIPRVVYNIQTTGAPQQQLVAIVSSSGQASTTLPPTTSSFRLINQQQPQAQQFFQQRRQQQVAGVKTSFGRTIADSRGDVQRNSLAIQRDFQPQKVSIGQETTTLRPFQRAEEPQRITQAPIVLYQLPVTTNAPIISRQQNKINSQSGEIESVTNQDSSVTSNQVGEQGGEYGRVVNVVSTGIRATTTSSFVTSNENLSRNVNINNNNLNNYNKGATKGGSSGRRQQRQFWELGNGNNRKLQDLVANQAQAQSRAQPVTGPRTTKQSLPASVAGAVDYAVGQGFGSRSISSLNNNNNKKLLN